MTTRTARHRRIRITRRGRLRTTTLTVAAAAGLLASVSPSWADGATHSNAAPDITFGPVGIPDQVQLGGSLDVDFALTDSVGYTKVDVTAHGPMACAPTASASYPAGTTSGPVEVKLDFPAPSAVQDAGGHFTPTGCAPGMYSLEIDVTDANGTHAYGDHGTPLNSSSGTPLTFTLGSAGTYVPVTPRRLLDTRNTQAIAPGGTLMVPVTKNGGAVPNGAIAVALNLTVTNTQAAGFITAYPADQSNPGTSNLNYGAGQTVPNMATVPLGLDGNIELYNHSGGTADVVVDIAGYYTLGSSGALYNPTSPARVLDTRYGTGGSGTVPGHGTVTLDVCNGSQVPSAADAAALNVTVTNPQSAGFLTVYPHGQDRPTASNLNFTAGETIPNMVTASLGGNCSVDIYNGGTGPADVVADTTGYFTPDTTGDISHGVFVPQAPERLFDTRTDGNASNPLAAHHSLTVWDREPATWGISSLLLNVTATQPTTGGFVTVFPDAGPVGQPADGSGLPVASNLNFTAGATVAGMANATVGADGFVDLYNSGPGTVQLIGDISGYYTGGHGS
ncbi:hypothetical protein GCM10009760_49920 [Kitasatospora kazusensis]|uniref:Uncharacterized protein n=1 Tax=Kitasatospora kazusensis TaxID=407974 RepID=A0ABN3A2V6_9ACTN